MCGIVGYIGRKQATDILIDGLKKLEYRGYDSAGISISQAGTLQVIKTRGRLAALEQKLEGMSLEATCGIGHTRWATHGEPNDVNSHPHLSANGRISLVHNGIIENYAMIKTFLEDKGVRFVSETDTEVIAQLLEYHYREEPDLMAAFLLTLNELEGAYALGVMCADQPDEFLAARKDSPLIVGLGEGENFIASDIPAILAHTREILIIEDREVVRVTRDGVTLFNLLGEAVSREPFHVDWDVAAAEKGGYEHFMMKEICEEPATVRATLAPRIREGKVDAGLGALPAEWLRAVDKIHVIACGTAYHAGMVGKQAIERLARIPVEIDVASEFRYKDPLVSDSHLAIVVSQSGETLDTLMALREARRKGAKVLAVVNVVGSSIAREADAVLYTWAGPEIAVASTKAYNTQLAALYLIALELAKRVGRLLPEQEAAAVRTLNAIPAALETIVGQKELIQRFAAAHFNAQSVFFIGRGLDYALSMEGSLKLKEISYIHSEAYAGGELKHGTIALIEQGTLEICPVTQENLLDKMVSNIREVKARGAVVLAVTTEKLADSVGRVADTVIAIPDVDPAFAPILAVTPLQLFAYYVSVMRGNDVDKPRNLAKSVTVE
jgi:glucosamine--fructose-6-phosphate aminotransferase (isomerizing)